MVCDHVEETSAASEYDFVLTSSDSELAQYIKKLRHMPEKSTRVIEISERYVTKSYRDDEIDDMKQAVDRATSIGVRTPTIRRIVRRDDVLECVQDRVDGGNLMETWGSLGWISTVGLAFQLRGMVRKMRATTSPTAGSLGTGICRSFWIEDRHGIPVSASARVITCVVNFWYNHKSFKREARMTPEEHAASVVGPVGVAPLVLTHHDLAPRNLMVDSSRRLWLVDWDYAGWYPPYFEYAAMHNFHAPETWGRLDRWRWNLFAWIATGSYGKEWGILVEAQRKSIRFPAARRFNIKAGATPSVKSPDD